MKLNRNKSSNKFCGPTALALLTGRHVDDTAHALRIASGKRAVKGATNTQMLKALDLMGYKASPIVLGTTIIRTTSKPKSPTFAQVLRTQLRGADKNTRFLVSLTGHFVCVQGRKLFDNRHPDGIYLGQCPYRRCRAKAIWAVERIGTEASPWTPPAAPMSYAMFQRKVSNLDPRLSVERDIVDAPTGYIFSGSGIHCRSIVMPYEDALVDLNAILPLVPCLDPECDMCHPESLVDTLEEVE